MYFDSEKSFNVTFDKNVEIIECQVWQSWTADCLVLGAAAWKATWKDLLVHQNDL